MKFTINLKEKSGNIHSFPIDNARDLVDAIKQAMNKAFRQYPDKSFKLESVEEDFLNP